MIPTSSFVCVLSVTLCAGVFAADSIEIAVIPKSVGGEFWETVEVGARQAADELGVKMRWDGAVAETQIAEQNQIIENLVNLGVDGIALAPLNQRATRRAVQNAVNAGIPVVIFDSGVDGDAHSSYVATNNRNGGVIAGEEINRLLGDKKGRVMCMRFVQGAGSTEARSDGFIETVKAAGHDVVATPYSDQGGVGSSKTTASNTFEKFITNGVLELDAVFAANLDSTLGTASALDDLRKSGVKMNLVFVGFDTSPKLVEETLAGNIHALVSQNPEKMGYLAVETIVKVIKGEEVPAVIDTGTVLVTKEKLENDPGVRKLVGLK